MRSVARSDSASARHEVPAPAASSPRAFIAVGDAERDLPAWITSVLGAPAELASEICTRSIEAECEFTRMLSVQAEAPHVGGGPAWIAIGRELFSSVLSASAALSERIARWWCFVPSINDPIDGAVVGDLDRYMAFNVGRREAHRAAGIDGSALTAASCVGHAGSRVVVHALLTNAALEAIENPRQVPAWKYSERYGPMPPSFARAVRVGGANGPVIVSGTASVVGEATAHAHAIDAQCAETKRNLEAIIGAARAGATLRDVAHARVYVVEPSSIPTARATFGTLGVAGEFLLAPLCRRDLLVEVEAYVPSAS